MGFDDGLADPGGPDRVFQILHLGAVVVDVAPFVHLRRDLMAALGTPNQSMAVGELAPLMGPGLTAAGKHILDLLPGPIIHQRLVPAGVFPAAPENAARVERMMKDMRQV